VRNSVTKSHGYCDSYRYRHSHIHAYTDCNSHSYSYSDGNCNSYCYSNCHRDTYGDVAAEADTHAETSSHTATASVAETPAPNLIGLQRMRSNGQGFKAGTQEKSRNQESRKGISEIERKVAASASGRRASFKYAEGFSFPGRWFLSS